MRRIPIYIASDGLSCMTTPSLHQYRRFVMQDYVLLHLYISFLFLTSQNTRIYVQMVCTRCKGRKMRMLYNNLYHASPAGHLLLFLYCFIFKRVAMHLIVVQQKRHVVYLFLGVSPIMNVLVNLKVILLT